MAENNDAIPAAAATNRSDERDETRAALSAAVRKLGQGYKRRRDFPRCSIRQEDDDSNIDEADYRPASALKRGYGYRRPVPLPDDDDLALGPHEANKASALRELEDGLPAAAHGPTHVGGDDGGEDGGEGAGAGAGEDDGLSTAHSSSYSTARTSLSLDTEEVVGFAMDWEEGDAAGGPVDKDKKLARSDDPAEFQGTRESARHLLTMGAYFASTAKTMLDEHRRARNEADMYMGEVILAMEKLSATFYALFYALF